MRLLPALIIALLLSLPVAAQEIVLVRHAEKAAEPVGDPGLTPDGQTRSQDLAILLRDTPPVLVLTSPARRTRDTAAPTALAAGVMAEAIPIPPGDLPSHIRLLMATLSGLKAGQVALVVGHGNTVPQLIAALGGPPLPNLPECAYDRLFRWHVAEKSLRIQQYGRKSDCPE